MTDIIFEFDGVDYLVEGQGKALAECLAILATTWVVVAQPGQLRRHYSRTPQAEPLCGARLVNKARAWQVLSRGSMNCRQCGDILFTEAQALLCSMSERR
jgi:hypothetical protein